MNQENYKDIGKTILLVLAASGFVITLAAFPGIAYALKALKKKEFENYPVYRINQAMKRMIKQQLIRIEEVEDKVNITILDKGKKRFYDYSLSKLKLKKGSWDQKWRVVVFDIPEEKRIARDLLRAKMKELGFYILQKSVWVTPWPCRDEIDFIKHFYEVAPCVRLIEGSRFEGEEFVKAYFRLR
jgi:DNA-binding transcriptional regulator PaaX